MSEAPPLYASGWQRMGAYALDTIIGLIFTSILRILTPELMIQMSIATIAHTLYSISLEGFGQHATLGKRMVGIYIAQKYQTPTSYKTIIFRYAFIVLPTLPLYYSMITHMSLMQEMQTYEHAAGHMRSFIMRPDVLSAFKSFGILYLFNFTYSLFLLWLPICFTKEKIGLHDWLSKTRVYKKQPEIKAIAP